MRLYAQLHKFYKRLLFVTLFAIRFNLRTTKHMSRYYVNQINCSKPGNVQTDADFSKYVIVIRF